MKTKRVRLFSAAAAAVALALGAASPAKAIMLSISSTTNATTTPLAGPGADRAASQSLNVLDTGGNSGLDMVGGTVNLATRYISNAAADRPLAFSGGTASATINTDYTVVFSVTPTHVLTTYDVVVDTRILGELTLLDDISGTQSTATVSNVTGRLGGVITPGLGIAGIAQNFSTGTGTNAAEERNISGSNSLNLGTFSGPQVFTLRFTFTTSASSPQSAINADEAAARFGANGPLGSATADDYPGPGDVVDRIQANDGHFMTATVTILTVPEPSTVALFGLGIVGLVVARFRRK